MSVALIIYYSDDSSSEYRLFILAIALKRTFNQWYLYIYSEYQKIIRLRLSPAEPHFPILFPILVQSDRFIFFRK